MTACRMQKHAGAFVGTAAGPRQQRLVQRQTRQTQTSISLRREGGSVSTGPRRIVCQSSRGKSDGSFWGGFLIGGTVFGVLGFLFAPQVSRALLNSERMKKLLGEGSENLEITREMLNDKISELNEAIDGVSAQLQTKSNDSSVRTGSE